jgi:iduronate 2-sulfatase
MRLLLPLLFLSQLALAKSPPNVLFIVVDDLTTTLRCQGHPASNTPHMDALAAGGARFDRAYCQFAVCNPARASFLTGCYPETTQVLDLVTDFRTALPDVVTLPQHFQNHGYAAGRIGKVFHVPDSKTKLGLELGAALHKDNELLHEAKQRKPDPTDPKRSKGPAYNKDYASSDRPDGDFTDHQIAEDALTALRGFGSKPFFLAVGFIRPHTPFVAPQWAFDAIDRSEIKLPPFYSESGEHIAALPKHSRRPNNNVFRYAPPSMEDALDATHAYLAAVHFVDHQIGRIMAELAHLKLASNTIIVLTGDHGYQLGEHGMWAKQTLFEGANHVPFIFAGPGIAPGVRQGLVEQVDIYPSLCALAELPLPNHLQGISLLPMLQDPAAKGKQVAISTMIATHTKALGHSLRTDAFRYISWDNGKGGELLYDLRSDPDELHNLAAKPQQTERMTRMRARLKQHLLKVQR